MIIGGYSADGSVDTVELLSLKSPKPECLKSRGSFPKKLYGAFGAFLEGRGVVCGGQDEHYNYLSTCWTYDTATDKWEEYGRMREARFLSAAALNNQYGWVISGGYGTDGQRGPKSSVEHTSDGRNFETLPSMPITLNSHCLVSLDGDEDGLFYYWGLRWQWLQQQDIHIQERQLE